MIRVYFLTRSGDWLHVGPRHKSEADAARWLERVGRCQGINDYRIAEESDAPGQEERNEAGSTD